MSVVFSPDRRQLLSSSFDKTARIWDASPIVEHETPGAFSVVGHSDRVNAVAFSGDGRYSIGELGQRRPALGCVDGQLIKTFHGHSQVIWGLVFSPDSSLLATASWDLTVKIWDVKSGREIKTLKGHAVPVHSVRFIPNGKQLVSSSWDGMVKVWDTASWTLSNTYQAHFSPACPSIFARTVNGSSPETPMQLCAQWTPIRFAISSS